jgi:hypothetical protein
MEKEKIQLFHFSKGKKSTIWTFIAGSGSERRLRRANNEQQPIASWSSSKTRNRNSTRTSRRSANCIFKSDTSIATEFALQLPVTAHGTTEHHRALKEKTADHCCFSIDFMVDHLWELDRAVNFVSLCCCSTPHAPRLQPGQLTVDASPDHGALWAVSLFDCGCFVVVVLRQSLLLNVNAAEWNVLQSVVELATCRSESSSSTARKKIDLFHFPMENFGLFRFSFWGQADLSVANSSAVVRVEQDLSPMCMNLYNVRQCVKLLERITPAETICACHVE